jgi:hypothetical protein
MENPLEEAKILQAIEANEKLENLNKISEASLVSQETGNDTMKDVSKILENRIVQADEDTTKIVNAIKDRPEVQKMEIIGKRNERASAFFDMLQGEQGPRGFTGDDGSVTLEVEDGKVITSKGEIEVVVKGKKGDKPSIEELLEIIEPLIPEPIKGDSYILTDKDKKEIAKNIKVPVVEKVIEKTETIIEKPITIDKTKTVVKEVAKYEEAGDLAKKLNTLSKAIDFKVIKNFPDMSKGAGGLSTVTADGISITGDGTPSNPLISNRVTVQHGANADYPRPNVPYVDWYGTVEPNNGQLLDNYIDIS